METEDRLESNTAIPPGLLLRDELRARHLTQKALALQMGTTIRVAKEICQGKREITADIALDLEHMLGIKAYIWMNLESDYRLTLARQRRQTEVRSTAA
ncbi:MAG: HigA family addiction module antidote protein [Chloroflexi bacterium]|nr:HigA family addiction module antidote protein [Chloroflexota bacterium]